MVLVRYECFVVGALCCTTYAPPNRNNLPAEEPQAGRDEDRREVLVVRIGDERHGCSLCSIGLADVKTYDILPDI